MTLQAGAATRVINCRIGDDLCGQLHRRLCERIRDNLEANAFYLSDGRESVLLLSLDLAGLFDGTYIPEVREAIHSRTGVAARNVIITNTHTHDGPDTLGLLHDGPKNETYLSDLRGWLLNVAAEAVAHARSARVGWAAGRAHVGFNRRLCWADGTHTMYGDARKEGFTGLEGPDDPTHAVLFATDARGAPIAVVHNNCCHATCVESATYASADFPGEARAALRAALGASLPVLYLQGASGDVSPWNMLRHPSRYDGELRAKEIGSLLAGETMRLIHECDLTESAVLRHAFEDISMAVRLPTADELAAAERVKAMGETKDRRWEYVLQVCGVLRLQKAFGDHPVDTVPVHAVRIGDFAIVTNPCELYCQFGLDMKRRSPARITAVAQLADGFSGYCPTIPALMGGGYSGDPTFWCRLEPFAGYKIVETSAGLLNRLWRG